MVGVAGIKLWRRMPTGRTDKPPLCLKMAGVSGKKVQRALDHFEDDDIVDIDRGGVKKRKLGIDVGDAGPSALGAFDHDDDDDDDDDEDVADLRLVRSRDMNNAHE